MPKLITISESLLKDILPHPKNTSLEKKIKSLLDNTNKYQTQNTWLEPMKIWIMEATNVAKTARGEDMEAKKVLAQKIFGSKLTLKDEIVWCKALNQWSALRADPPTRDWERDTRIGLAALPWEGSVLPLYKSRITGIFYQIIKSDRIILSNVL